MEQLSILLDLVVATLLIATIVYASVLNRKLAVLRNNKQEMEAMVNRLVQTTEQAEHGLADLKEAAGEKGDELDKRVKDATALVDDLGFLVDKGNSLADRLERQIGQARGTVAAAASGKPVPAETKTDEPPAESRETVESKPAGKAASGGKSRTTKSSSPQNAKLLKALRGVR